MTTPSRFLLATLATLPLWSATGCGQMSEPSVDRTPLPGVDTSSLAGEHLDRFYKLVDSLDSPCGKAESLRASYANGACKRAPFAVTYLRQLIVDEFSEEKIRELWRSKYSAITAQLDVSKAPRRGRADAPIRVVELYDYACPHCAAFAPVLSRVGAANKDTVVEYFLQLPFEDAHPQARSAAKAALAANALGNFDEMDELLFARSPRHARADVEGYAAQLGLDPGEFAIAYDAADAQVSRDQKQGETLGVESTPAVFINGRRYTGPQTAEYLGLWIEEELAANR
jgi:protein-disulfide isomerase